MQRSEWEAPARRTARAGAFTCLLGALLLAACDRVAPGAGEGPRVLELEHDTIRLEAGVRLIDVEVRREAGGEFHPAAVEARVGDVVRFTADDNAGHAIAFAAPMLRQDAHVFLEGSGQLRSPPLITRGASWVITLENAPSGEYPFVCSTHNVQGRLVVTAGER